MSTTFESNFRDDDPTEEFPVLTEAWLEQADSDSTGQFLSSTPPAPPEPCTDVRDEHGSGPAHTDRAAATDTQAEDSQAAPLAASESLAQRLTELGAELALAHAQLALQAARLVTIDQALDAHALQRAAWQAEIASARTTIDALTAELLQSRTTTGSLKAELAQARTSIETFTTGLEQVRAENETLTSELALARTLGTAAQPSTPPAGTSPATGPAHVATEQQLREQLATLADHIMLRNREWQQARRDLADARQRSAELERELAQRTAREQAAQQQAEQARERLTALEQHYLAALQERAATAPADRLPPAPPAPGPAEPPPQEAADAHRTADDTVQDLRPALHGLLAPAAPGDASSERPRPPQRLDAQAIPAQLICLTSDVPTIYPLRGETLTIGRSTRCDIRLATHYVSREHAAILTTHEGCVIEDLGSKNGIFVNAVRAQSQRLRHGDLITVGDAQFRFVSHTDDPAA